MLTDECNKQKDATDQPDNQTNLSWRHTSSGTKSLQYMPQFMQHMQTVRHRTEHNGISRRLGGKISHL